MPIYPTKEQILTELYTPTESEYNAVRKWKRLHFNKQWKTLSAEQKTDRIQELIGSICEARGIRRNQWPILQVSEHPWSYNHGTKIITMGLASPSVISALHELGHFLHFSGYLAGEHDMTEFIACRYSTGIYKICFPKSFARLTWQNHTLVAPRDDSRTE